MEKEEKLEFANKVLLNKCNLHNNHIFKESFFKKTFSDIYDDIMSISFPDDFTFGQKLWHYIYEDNEFNKICKCPLHGKLKFLDFRRGYREFCTFHCEEYNRITSERRKQTRIKNAGSLEESYKKGLEKQKKTCIERYGVENAGGIPESIEKQKKTCLERYGSKENLNIINKIKSDQTRIERYGSVDESYRMSIEKRKETLKNKSEDYYKDISRKVKKSKLNKYGDENYNNFEKYKSTCLSRYGVDNFFKTDHIKRINKEKWNERTLGKYNEILYINNDIYHCKCIDSSCEMCNEKEFDIDIHTFFNRKFYNFDICTVRNPIKEYSPTSGEEKSLLLFIKSIYSGEIIENDRNILSGKELDIYIPDKKIAFEFNGIYWHNEFNKPKNYHQEKSLSCLKKGIQLIHIWEDDWIARTDIIKDIIKSKMGISDINIGARKCDAKYVSNKDAKKFLDMYHIQGGVKNGRSIGLYYNDQLVELLTFGQLRKNMGGIPQDGYYEIYRVCSKSGYNIQGGFSKLLKFFENEHHPVCVITYGNLDYTCGNVYKKCGFLEERLSKPTYTWVIDGIRKHRSNFMKSKLSECVDNPDLTESEVMHNRGSWRCWDSGKIKFIKEY